jgi:D-alanyl-lipoteichoic acid acyltransferase DltB (MBOAT superfamily)
MLFNSTEFLLFFPLVFWIYWRLLGKNNRSQNAFLLVASYFFYGWWDYRFLSLIGISSFVDYSIGIQIDKSEKLRQRKLLLCVSLVTNLGILGFFKYYNFFIESFIDLLSVFGIQSNYFTLSILLPVGISFYTFQTLSYTIDIYRRELKPTKNWLSFFTFVSFFPQLVAGPIERARHLLPQIEQKRHFDYGEAKDGCRQILCGLFKKIVIADTLAPRVDFIFQHYHTLSPEQLLLGGVYFAFQIYGDFSGYSDIAIGLSKLLGIKLRRNFWYPYFSRNISEFWQRWHISLSTWFRDYVFIPLGGSRSSSSNTIRNVLITFLLSGFWHGANWTFLFWGFLNSIYYVIWMVFFRKRPETGVLVHKNSTATLAQLPQILATFFLSVVAWIFFRSASVSQAYEYLLRLFTLDSFQLPAFESEMTLVAFLVALEWMQRKNEHALDVKGLPIFVRWTVYLSISHLVYMYHNAPKSFIYFQF